MNKRGERRELRSRIRNDLGVSRDGPPRFMALIGAARNLSRLLNLTTGGYFRVTIQRNDNGQWVDAGIDDLAQAADNWSDD